MNLAEWEAQLANAASGVVGRVLTHLPEGGTFVDVGANVGTVSLAAQQSRNAHVIAFEPVGTYYDRCKEVLGPTADVVPIALGDETGVRTLWCDENNLGWNTLVVERATSEMYPVVVPVERFDDYADITGLDALDVVKIDVEGYEHAVLGGMRATLSRFHPVLVVELGWGRSHPQRGLQVAALEWLFANGYERTYYDFDATTDVTIVPS